MGHIPRIFACMKSKNDAIPMSCVQVALVLADSTVSTHYCVIPYVTTMSSLYVTLSYYVVPYVTMSYYNNILYVIMSCYIRVCYFLCLFFLVFFNTWVYRNSLQASYVNIII